MIKKVMSKAHPSFICGIDEVGRGPLAGPLVSAAVILPANTANLAFAGQLRDSKELSATSRSTLSELIQGQAIAAGSGWVWQNEIDRINVHRATLRAMLMAMDEAIGNFMQEMNDYNGLKLEEILVLRIDGRFIPDITQSQFSETLKHCDIQAIIKGDSKIPAISAASILAKVARDKWMTEYHKTEPNYGFDKHKGYPTPAHKEAIRRHGPSAIQRMTFKAC